MKVSKGGMVVLKGKMPRGLYRLVGNVHIGGAIWGAFTSNSSERHIASRERVILAFSTEGGDDFRGLI